jgi:PleD family two-component response regulator
MVEHQDIIRNRLQYYIDSENSRENRDYKISLSTGIACYNPENPCSIDELMAEADQLMYEQKKSKKSCSI